MTNFEQSMRMLPLRMSGQTEQRQQANILRLEPASPTAPKVTAVHIEPDDVDGFDLADPDRTGDLETVDVGPFAGEFVRLVSSDLVQVADALRRLADRIIDTTVDSREELAAMECPYCTTILDPGVTVCGAEACQRELELDRIAEGAVEMAAARRRGWS